MGVQHTPRLYTHLGCTHTSLAFVTQLIDGPSEEHFMQLWNTAHTIDHLAAWEEASGAPSFGSLRAGFNTAMQRLTVAGIQLHLV